jgi:hypothetical protein
MLNQTDPKGLFTMQVGISTTASVRGTTCELIEKGKPIAIQPTTIPNVNKSSPITATIFGIVYCFQYMSRHNITVKKCTIQTTPEIAETLSKPYTNHIHHYWTYHNHLQTQIHIEVKSNKLQKHKIQELNL